MPIYEYQCLRCEKKTEVLQRFDEAPLAVCPDCGGEVKKLISSPAFQFKGSGWYVTDYARKGGAAKSEAKSDAGSSGETAAKDQGETKASAKEKSPVKGD
jgi:putative FmdB family regulatory protein